MIEKDENLIISFVIREAEDYTPQKNSGWIAMVFDNIRNKLPDNLGQLKLISIGNTGITLRELILYGTGENKCHLLVDTDGNGAVDRVL